MQLVIEGDRLPIAFCVAISAFHSISPLVLIVLLVAGVTIQRGVSKRRCQMAFLALDLRVLPH